MPAQFRFNGTVRNTIGEAVPGVQVFVCTQPLTSGAGVIPPTPLASLYANATGPNSATITDAEYLGGFIEFTFSGALPADVLPGSFIAVTAVNPTGYNAVWQVVSIDTVNFKVIVTLPFEDFAPNPGTYVSGGTVATSALPNPIITDGLGNFFFYTASGTYTLIFFDPENRIPTVSFPDTQVTAPGGGSVTSVGIEVPDGFAVSPPTITTSAVFVIGYSDDWSIGEVIIGPPSGPDSAPTRRRLQAADIAGLASGSVTSVGVSLTAGSLFTSNVTGSPVLTSGVIALSFDFANAPANKILAGPQSGSPGPVTARSLVAADVPAGLAINWRGAWNGGTSYAVNDAVFDGESSYICIIANTGSEPPSADWNLLAGPGAVALAGDLGGGSPSDPHVIGLLGTGVIPFTLYFFINGAGTNAQKLFRNKLENGITVKFPASAPNSEAIAGTAATGSTTYTFKKNGTPFATAVWSASGTVGAWTQASDATFIGGTDILEVDGPSTADATLADIGITFAGVRTA